MPYVDRRLLLKARLVVLLLAVFAIAACDGDDAPAPTVAPTPEVALALPADSAPLTVAIDVTDPVEASDLEERLVAAGFALDPAADTRISDGSATATATTYALDAFALVVHPRFPLLDITVEEAVAIIEGRSELGRQLRVSTPARSWLDQTYPSADRSSSTVDLMSVIDEVASTPGLVGLIPVNDLDPRVRALTIGGHDPYRDPWDESPLLDHRSVTGPDAEDVAAALGWTEVALADPVGYLATGELIPARCVTERVSTLEDGYGAIFNGTRELLSAADLAMAHWEPSIVDDDNPTPCVATFNMSTVPAAATAAARAGIDVALAVGNHLGDCWSGCSYVMAVQQTVSHLQDAGLVVAGAGDTLAEARRPALVTVDGVTFAFLGYDEIAWAHYGAGDETAGTAHADRDGLASDVQAAAARADHVIVGFSWGIEYTADPSGVQREAARTAIEAGASLVVGNHPHWVQATEWVGEGFIAYGLGNFVFDQDWSVETTQGAVLEVGFTAERILGVRFRPTAVRQQHLVELVDPTSDEGMAILDQIWRATDAIP